MRIEYLLHQACKKGLCNETEAAAIFASVLHTATTLNRKGVKAKELQKEYGRRFCDEIIGITTSFDGDTDTDEETTKVVLSFTKVFNDKSVFFGLETEEQITFTSSKRAMDWVDSILQRSDLDFSIKNFTIND